MQAPIVRPYGFNVIGYISSNLGMGLTARQFVRLLLNHGYAVSVFDVPIDSARTGHDLEFAHLSVDKLEELPHAVNLIMLDIGSLPQLLINRLKPIFTPNRLNVGLIWWELTVLPKRWVKALECFDVLLAGSGFVRHLMESHLSRVRILPCNHPIFGQPSSAKSRDYFGLPNDGFLFLSSFEPNSDPARKNPFAAITAFKGAFGPEEKVHLVIKMNNPHVNDEAGPAQLVERMRAMCANDPRIIVIAKSLPYSDVLSLYQCCDALVSLHRAEGLGLAPLECMGLGKPVIATAWSGNLSYMTYSNSCLVRFELVPVSGSVKNYTSEFLGEQAYWAEPDIDEAARWMRLLFNDPELCRNLGRRAQEDYAKYQSQAEQACFLSELEVIWKKCSLFAERSNYTANLPALMDAEYSANCSWLKYRTWKLNNWLDRHVLWRFRG